jgi:hypothetical protein
VAYFCKYLSICCLGSTNPSQGDRNSGEDGFPYIDRTGVYPLVAGMQSGPGMASASLCGLMNVAADKRSDDCATLPAALLLTRLQLHLGISERTREGRVGAGARRVAVPVAPAGGRSGSSCVLVAAEAVQLGRRSARRRHACGGFARSGLLWPTSYMLPVAGYGRATATVPLCCTSRCSLIDGR